MRRDQRAFSYFSRGVIFTHARVSLALLSLRKNGDYSQSRLLIDNTNYFLVTAQFLKCGPQLRTETKKIIKTSITSQSINWLRANQLEITSLAEELDVGLPKTNSADRLEPGESLLQVQHFNHLAVPPPYLNKHIIREIQDQSFHHL